MLTLLEGPQNNLATGSLSSQSTSVVAEPQFLPGAHEAWPGGGDAPRCPCFCGAMTPTANEVQGASFCSPSGGTVANTGIQGARARLRPADANADSSTLTHCHLISRLAGSYSHLGEKRYRVHESSSWVTSLWRCHGNILSRVRKTWSHGATWRCPIQ